MLPGNIKNVLSQRDESVPVAKPVQVGCCRKLITKKIVESLAVEKCRTNGRGITIEDITTKCTVKKSKAQRSLKYFHSTGVVFTANDLIREGILLLQNKNPQEYFAACMKAEILENLKKRKSVPVQPTGVNLQKGSNYPLSNALEHQKASSFLEVLATLPFVPPYLHKLQLMFNLNREYYNGLEQKEGEINRAKLYTEFIGRRRVTYIMSPNGTVEVYIKTNDSPLKIEKDET